MAVETDRSKIRVTSETLDEWFKTRSKSHLKTVGKASLILMAQRNVKIDPSTKPFKDMKMPELEEIIHAEVSQLLTKEKFSLKEQISVSKSEF